MAYKTLQTILAGLENRDWIALSKAITVVENHLSGREAILKYAYHNSREDSVIFGITGSGKSTLIDGLISCYVKDGKTVGVLAIDPSSVYTRGALLGDRIRMGKNVLREDVFIRSFASRGSLGGISQGAKDVLYLYKAFGFDVIIVESYGVGQAETDIANFVDVTAIVIVPGNGDEIQLAKAGIQEIGDVFVVNKADHEGADALAASLAASFVLLPADKRPEIVKTVARDHKGTEELAALLLATADKLSGGRASKKRLRILNEITSNAYRVIYPAIEREAEKLLAAVERGCLTPFEAAEKLSRQMIIQAIDEDYHESHTTHYHQEADTA